MTDEELNNELARISTTLVMHRTLQDRLQRDLAEDAGVSHCYVKSVERGRHWPNLKTLIRLAAALGYRLDLVPLEPDGAE